MRAIWYLAPVIPGLFHVSNPNGPVAIVLGSLLPPCSTYGFSVTGISFASQAPHTLTCNPSAPSNIWPGRRSVFAGRNFITPWAINRCFHLPLLLAVVRSRSVRRLCLFDPVSSIVCVLLSGPGYSAFGGTGRRRGGCRDSQEEAQKRSARCTVGSRKMGLAIRRPLICRQ